MQMKRLASAFIGHNLVVVTTHAGYRGELAEERFYTVTDANLRSKFRLMRLAVEVGLIVARERPDVVISTGAAPGYFALRFGKVWRAKTVWVDSIANVDQLSVSGAKVRRYADLWLTQWAHLARPNGPQYVGSVL